MEPQATKGLSQSQIDGHVFLHPRPKTHPRVAIALLPLLPQPTCVPLPPEMWARILRLTMILENASRFAHEAQAAKMRLILVSRMFKNIISPMIYAEPYLPSLDVFLRFSARLLEADSKWDNLRRIPYSTPGRWVHTLNLLCLQDLNVTESFEFDRSLNRLFSVLPFLEHLYLHHSISLSRPTMRTLAESETATRLQSLTSIKIPAVTFGSQPRFARASFEDPLTNFVRSCSNLQHMELVGHGWDIDNEALDTGEEDSSYPEPSPISLPVLTSLSLIDVSNCPLLVTLAYSPLPSLKTLSISLYSPPRDQEVRKPDSTIFFERHGASLQSLTVRTARSWPQTTNHAPENLLLHAPNLKYLSLPSPSSDLILPQSSGHRYVSDSPTSISFTRPVTEPHSWSPSTSPSNSQRSPLRTSSHTKPNQNSDSKLGYPLLVLSIPRPTPELLYRVVEPGFVNLREVRVRDVKYLKRSMGRNAAGTGASAVMMEWRRILAKRGVRVLDSQGHTGPQ